MASNKACLFVFAGILFAFPGMALADRIADVRNTKHNLSATGPGTLKATTETQVCVFCHTPHGATQGVTPLWNRQLSSQTYTTYTSSSLDANAIQGSLDQPGGSSKLCLSCHDGTLAIGNVNVLDGRINQSVTLTGTGLGGVMYCSDCHGSNVTSATSGVPDGGENGKPWGPHGSSNNFILKGTWSATTGTGEQATGACFKCHDYATYATRSDNRTGFFSTDKGDLHTLHADKIGRMAYDLR